MFRKNDPKRTVEDGVKAVSYTHLFYAGPSILNEGVIKEAGKAVENFAGTGLSILEVSHRGKAVSYTHLDVYKRQAHSRPPKRDEKALIINTTQ